MLNLCGRIGRYTFLSQNEFSYFHDYCKGWKSGNIVEKTFASDSWKIQYDDGDEGAVDFPEEEEERELGCLLTGADVSCDGPMNKTTPMHSKVAVKDAAGDFAIGTVLGCNLDFSQGNVHLDDDTQAWFSTDDIFPLKSAKDSISQEESPKKARASSPKPEDLDKCATSPSKAKKRGRPAKTEEPKNAPRRVAASKPTTDGPPPPKGAKSSYIFFASAQRKAVEAEMGAEVDGKLVVSELGARWRALKEDEKIKWTEECGIKHIETFK
jgi:hypothetical protein